MMVAADLALRAPIDNPRTGVCSMALRRICGVCKHHTGETMRHTGECRRHFLTSVPGQRSAAECKDFERPTVAPKPKSKPQPQARKSSKSAAQLSADRARVLNDKVKVAQSERHALIRRYAGQGLRQKDAAALIGISRTQLNRDLVKMGVRWSDLQRPKVRHD